MLEGRDWDSTNRRFEIDEKEEEKKLLRRERERVVICNKKTSHLSIKSKEA